METGLFLGKIPYITGGSGPRRAVVFFGANALFGPLDRSDARRYAGAGRRVAGQLTFLGAGDLDGLGRDNAALCRRPWYNGLARPR